VLCGQELIGKGGITFLQHLPTTDKNHHTPIIVMSESQDAAQVAFLVEQGIRHFLHLPFTAIELHGLISQICDLRKRRAFPRYTIEGAYASILFDDSPIEAEIINTSLFGLFCSFNFPRRSIELLKINELSIVFPQRYELPPAMDIKGQILRIVVDSWDVVYCPNVVRCAWKFLSVPEKTTSILEKGLEAARLELFAAEEHAKRISARIKNVG
jgi:CheY-like chemotaxis protein